MGCGYGWRGYGSAGWAASPGRSSGPGRPAAGSGYRVGDADRNRVVDLLTEACAAGYLTLEENEARVAAALHARTRADLDAQLADLPPEWLAARAPVPPAPPVWRRLVNPATLLAVAAAVALLVAVVGPGHHQDNGAAWALLWLAGLLFWRSRRHRAASVRYRGR